MPGTLPVAGDLLEFRTCCYTPTQIFLNVLHYYVTGQTGAGNDLDAIAAQYENLVAASYKALMAPTAKWRGVGVVNLMTPRSREATSTVQDGVGTTGTILAPSQATYLIKMNALPAGRRYQGRIYPGPIAVDNLATNGELSVAGALILENLRVQIGTTRTLTQDGNTTTMNLAIRHPDAIIAGVRTPQFSTVVNTVISNKIATQKRRGDYGRQNSIPF